MVVNQVEHSLSISRIQGLSNHRPRLQRATLEPRDDLREEMSVQPGPHKGEFLLHDLLLTDVAGRRREAEETNAAGWACKAASFLQERRHARPVDDHRGTQ